MKLFTGRWGIVSVASVILASHYPIPSMGFTEREALMTFYDDLDGESWTNNMGWGSDVPLCAWYGIVCSGEPTDDSGVTEVNLSYNQLTGKIPPKFWHLPSLANVTLKGNTIHHAGFAGFTNGDTLAPLEELVLSENSLVHIDNIQDAPMTLTKLHFTSNRLTGSVLEDLFKVQSLEYLYVSFNLIGGPIPTTIGDMLNLEKFYSYGNRLTGTIPTEIGKMTGLEVLTFAENLLEGTVPTEIELMTSLQTFSVHNNDDNTGTLTGPLPTLANLKHLTEFYLDGNAINGTIPDNFLQHSRVTSERVYIGLANNELTGGIPLGLSKFEKLMINLVGNDIDYLSDDFCELGGWMDGLVADYGCDAILCPKGTYSDLGRQISDVEGCTDCPNLVSDAPFFGSTDCDTTNDVEGTGEVGGSEQDNPTGENEDEPDEANPMGAEQEESGGGGKSGKGWKVAVGLLVPLAVIALAFYVFRRRRGSSNNVAGRNDGERDMRDFA